MTTLNPELPKNSEALGAKNELKTLKTGVSEDYKKFETLSKNSSLKSGLQKIIKKELDGRITAFAQNHNKYSKERVGYYTAGMVKDHKELIPFISGELGLPIKTDKSRVEYDFSVLSFEKKLRFMALYEAQYDFGSFKNVGTKQIIEKYNSYIEKFGGEATKKFNERIESKTNVLGYVNLEKTLKNEYGLTDSEYKKMKEYIELIQKHPEYVGGKFKVQVEQAGGGWGYLVAYLLGALTMVLGYFTRDYVFGLKKTEQVASGGKMELQNFEECFEIMAAKAEYKIVDENGKDGVITYEENAIEFKEGGPRRLKMGKDGIESVVNYFEGRRIDLKAKIGVGYKYDAKSARCFVDKVNGKGIVYVKIREPKLEVIDVKAEVVKSKREKIVNLNKFDDFELRALESLKQEALKKTDTPENQEKAKESLRKSILGVFRTTGYAGLGMVIEGKDIQDVVIEYDTGFKPLDN